MNWRRPGVAGAVLQSFQEPKSRARYLIYLHGRYDEPSSIVLGERDYRDSYVRSDETFRKLFAIFSMHPVVFFGCSMRDLDVLAIFRQVFAATERLRHFAVLPLADDAAHLRMRFRLRYGISPILYEPGGEQHPNFERLMFDLAGRRWRSRAPEVASERIAEGTWASRKEFLAARGAADPDDPQKGRFGGKAAQNGRKLTARVTADRDREDWFDVRIEVRSTDDRPLRGKVDVWVHDSFPREHYQTFVRDGVARLGLSAYGAFTVGVTCDAGRTALELDLSALPNAPRRFRQR